MCACQLEYSAFVQRTRSIFPCLFPLVRSDSSCCWLLPSSSSSLFFHHPPVLISPHSHLSRLPSIPHTPRLYIFYISEVKIEGTCALLRAQSTPATILSVTLDRNGTRNESCGDEFADSMRKFIGKQRTPWNRECIFNFFERRPIFVETLIFRHRNTSGQGQSVILTRQTLPTQHN